MIKSKLTHPTLRKWLVVSTSIVCLALVSINVQAYTLYTDLFPAASTNYVKDANFINYSPGFSSTADSAAADWNATGTFSFSFNAGSANHLKTQIMSDPTILAIMYPVETLGGIHRDRFDIVVNTCCGHPFYDGTQAPSLPPNYYDLRTVLRHEFGHALGLWHSAAGGALMNAIIPVGTIRFVDIDAQNGAGFLYNGSYTGPFPEGGGAYGTAGTGSYENLNPNVGYKGTNWIPNTLQPRASLNTLSWSNSYGAATWLAFNGSQITRTYTKHNLRGPTQIYIDGSLVETLDAYSASTRWQVQKTWAVTPGNHVIVARNFSAGGAYTDLDVFKVNIPTYGSSDSANTLANKYIGSWTHSTCCSSAYNGTISWSNTAQDAVTFTCTCSQITYVFTKAYNRGIAAITLDNTSWGTIDLYASPNQWQQSQTFNFGSYGVHTIHISVTGQKNASSADYYVDVDRMVVP